MLCVHYLIIWRSVRHRHTLLACFLSHKIYYSCFPSTLMAILLVFDLESGGGWPERSWVSSQRLPFLSGHTAVTKWRNRILASWSTESEHLCWLINFTHLGLGIGTKGVCWAHPSSREGRHRQHHRIELLAGGIVNIDMRAWDEVWLRL